MDIPRFRPAERPHAIWAGTRTSSAMLPDRFTRSCLGIFRTVDPPLPLQDDDTCGAISTSRVAQNGADRRSGSTGCQMRPGTTFVAAGYAMKRPCKELLSASDACIQAGGHLLLAPPLHRGRNAQRLPVLGHRAPGNVDTVALQLLDDLVIGKHGCRRFRHRSTGGCDDAQLRRNAPRHRNRPKRSPR